jgi:ABC-type transport system substrate-binding protein
VLPALFRLNAALRPEPELAVRWPRAADIRLDPFSVTLRLRVAAWSDGAPITAEDVRFSFDKLKGGPTGYRYRSLRDVEVRGPRTLTLHFDRPVRRWWALFSLDDMVLPAHAYSPAWAQRPTVSGGPFEVAEWTEGLRVRLVRNNSYWGPKAVLAGIDVLFVPNDETRFQLLERGELDAFFSEGDVNMGRRSRARGYLRTGGALTGEKAASGAWGPTWWELNLRRDLGAGVTQAAIEAADPSLVAEILEDSAAPMDGIPASFPVPSGSIAGTWSGRGNLDEARAQAARGGRRAFDLSFPRSSASSIAAFLHFRLRELGITVELVGLEEDAFERSLDNGSAAPAVIRLRRGADAPDVAAYASSSNEPGSAPVDDFIVGAQTAGAGAARRVGVAPAPWRQAQDGIEGAGTAAPLARVRSWIVGRDGLAGPQALGALPGPLWNVTTWRFV